MLETDRLRLIPFLRSHADALRRPLDELARMLGVDAIPDGWPEFPEAYRRLPPGDTGWGTYAYVLRDGSSLVGSGGYKGEPRGSAVEIGYEVAPPFRGRGFATEAAAALVDRAFADATVASVLAHTLPEPNASARVLEKVGMVLEATVEDPDDGPVRRWRVRRRD